MSPSDALQLAVAERRRKIYELHLRGISHDEIARLLAVPGGAPMVTSDVRDINRRLTHDVYDDLEDMRATAAARIDMLISKAWDVLEAEHPVLYQGEIVSGVEDSGPVLAAVARIRELEERRAKLLGLDAPAKTVAGVTVRYEIPGMDPEAIR